MTETMTRQLQAGQDYDPGYDVPELRIGQRISGRTVIAAIRQHDCAGFLPGLHIAAAYDPDPDQAQPYVTWEIAWQPRSVQERIDQAARLGIAVTETEPGRWVANAGHYTAAGNDALYDMAVRAGVVTDRRGQLSGGVLTDDL